MRSVPVCLFKQTAPQVLLISHVVFAECQETGKYTEIKRNCSDVRKKNRGVGGYRDRKKRALRRRIQSNKVNEKKEVSGKDGESLSVCKPLQM